ncbi:hypothetical protein BV22DRAFT_778477 [Leucogyrophana mollusca]|uniref:Uncharacterized protein n=1 Tax=Leucogyrophana mollusca TaxID=85980 RepID=A0ACB8B511_9AGAM|nr:hypothetical protein BV22DRAFT_778477 [Leucogyrophana mollusca]
MAVSSVIRCPARVTSHLTLMSTAHRKVQPGQNIPTTRAGLCPAERHSFVAAASSPPTTSRATSSHTSAIAKTQNSVGIMVLGTTRTTMTSRSTLACHCYSCFRKPWPARPNAVFNLEHANNLRNPENPHIRSILPRLFLVYTVSLYGRPIFGIHPSSSPSTSKCQTTGFPVN